MSQSDFIIENQSGSQFRRDVQSALQAAVSSSIGRAAPTTTYAGQIWFDSEENELKIRNEGNNAWIVFADTNSVLNHIRLRTSVLRAIDERGITLEALNGADLLRVTESGNVSGAAIATAAQIAAGTADNKLVRFSDANNRGWDYTSPTVHIASINTFIHGLGERPTKIGVDFICVRNIPGVAAVGDALIDAGPGGSNRDGRGMGLIANRTRIKINMGTGRFGNSMFGFIRRADPNWRWRVNASL